MMLTFLKPGYLKEHPQSSTSTFTLAFFIFSLLFLFLVVPISHAASCGDENCYKGYDEVGFSITFLGSSEEGILESGEEEDFVLNDTQIMIEILSVNSTSKKASIHLFSVSLVNETDTILGIGESYIFHNFTIKVENISTSVDSEEISCPQDCSPDKFVRVGDNFYLGTGACRKSYKFIGYSREQNALIIKKDAEQMNVSYSTSSSNTYGYLAKLEVELYDKEIEFNLRFNDTTALLYLENKNTTCPIVNGCSASKDCDDNNPCTFDECDGQPLKCKHALVVWCRDNDGCCYSPKCDYIKDNDCTSPHKCDSDNDCNDNDTCTTDTCIGDPRSCLNLPIDTCVFGDQCCPSGCNYSKDQDCKKPAECGDNTCEEGENQENCCVDCGCKDKLICKNNTCVKSQELIAEEILDANQAFRSKKEDLLLQQYTFSGKTFLQSGEGFYFEYKYIRGEQESILRANVTNDGNVTLLSSEKISFLPLFIALAILAPILVVGLGTYLILTKKHKETHYQNALQQKYGGSKVNSSYKIPKPEPLKKQKPSNQPAEKNQLIKPTKEDNKKTASPNNYNLPFPDTKQPQNNPHNGIPQNQNLPGPIKTMPPLVLEKPIRNKKRIAPRPTPSPTPTPLPTSAQTPSPTPTPSSTIQNNTNQNNIPAPAMNRYNQDTKLAARYHRKRLPANNGPQNNQQPPMQNRQTKYQNQTPGKHKYHRYYNVPYQASRTRATLSQKPTSSAQQKHSQPQQQPHTQQPQQQYSPQTPMPVRQPRPRQNQLPPNQSTRPNYSQELPGSLRQNNQQNIPNQKTISKRQPSNNQQTPQSLPQRYVPYSQETTSHHPQPEDHYKETAQLPHPKETPKKHDPFKELQKYIYYK